MLLSRSARMLDEMPSSEPLSSSRKWRRPPNTMSRRITMVHLSPITSTERLIGQPERCSASILKPFEKQVAFTAPSVTTTSCKMQPQDRHGCSLVQDGGHWRAGVQGRPDRHHLQAAHDASPQAPRPFTDLW